MRQAVARSEGARKRALHATKLRKEAYDLQVRAEVLMHTMATNQAEAVRLMVAAEVLRERARAAEGGTE